MPSPAKTASNVRPRATIEELSRRLRPGLTPLAPKFSWHGIFSVAEEDLRQYLNDPVSALPPAVVELLPGIGIVLAPYLERGTGKGAVTVVEEKPGLTKLVLSSRVVSDDFVMLFFTVKDEQVADYHYFLYDELAAMVSQRWPKSVEEIWYQLLREELGAEVHGEVDERSWHAKQSLLRRPLAARKEGKAFREYARKSFHDTLTLFLHGICCDIDVETGPRQIPSRYFRKRLEQLKALFPPPEGHAVFPEDLPKA